MTIQSDRCRVFHELHASGCFVIPNPWDVGSARALVSLGFKAVATTSSCSVADNGTTWKRRAHRSGTSATACAETRSRLATGSLYRFARALVSSD